MYLALPCGSRPGSFLPAGIIAAQGPQVLVLDAQQIELFEVGVVEAPATAQVEVQPVAEDVTHGLLGIAAQARRDVAGVLQVFTAD
ncbi:hypothetical protein D9M68_715370 [compost metagenome]